MRDLAGRLPDGWDDPDPAAVAEDAILARLLVLNLQRAGGPSERRGGEGATAAR